MELRPYQEEAVKAILDSLNAGKKSVCVNMATGTGKSLTLASLAQRFTAKGHHVTAITHVRELIRQLESAALTFLPKEQVGVIAAGLGRKDPPRQFQICQIQSVGRNPDRIGPRRIVIIDELQLINQEKGQYAKVIDALRIKTPDLRIVGLSATPWRTVGGLSYGPGKMFEECVYRYDMRQGIRDGFLCPMVGKTGDKDFHIEGVATLGGDYKPDELENFMADQIKVSRAIADCVPRTKDRNQCLVFCVGRRHMAMVAETLAKAGQSVGCIDGTMGEAERDKVLASFRNRQFKWLCNVGVLTTGFDDTGIDAIIMLRPTKSPGLLLQIAGRGLRKDPRKENCVFLDYGGNLSFWGPLDSIEETITDKKPGKKGQAPTKVCPECDTVLPASATVCTTCGKLFPRVLRHEEEASDAPVTSDTPIKMDVSSINIRPHHKAGKPMTMRIDYVSSLGIPQASEFLSISPEANMYAYRKSLKELANWKDSPFKLMGDTLYLRQADGQLRELDTQGIISAATTLTPPVSITTIRDGKYVSITKKVFL